MGGDEVENVEPVAAQSAGAFAVVGFGASDSVVLGGNNDPAAFIGSDDEKAKVKALVDWML